MNKKYYISLLLLLPAWFFGQTLHLVAPNTADPLSAAPNYNHYTYINQTVDQQNKLFLFFPGTGAVPYNYSEILKHAANLGYHAIGLTYPNTEAINEICLSTTDTTCHSRARLEVFDGIERHDDIHVDVNNCIERRTLKLLQFLNSNYPDENWGQYYSGNEILWDKVMLSGHSQGGGHAGIISKIKQVERVAMFSAMDWIGLLNRNADWITWDGLTPEDKYYGFIHQNDESVNFDKCQITWDNYGMGNFGSLVLVDSSTDPYDGTHKLYTLLTPANDPAKFHGCVVADAYTPMDLSVPVYAPVWTYMIQGSGNLSAISSTKNIEKLSIYPNPFSTETTLYLDKTYSNTSVTIFNAYGEQVRELKNISGQEVNLQRANLQAGIYFIKLSQGNEMIGLAKFVLVD